MRKLLLIGRWFRGRNKIVVDLQAYRELKKKREDKQQARQGEKPTKEKV